MHVNITQSDIEVILPSRESTLHNNRIPWIKKEGDRFGVTMSA